jgi:hypothetical protein
MYAGSSGVMSASPDPRAIPGDAKSADENVGIREITRK